MPSRCGFTTRPDGLDLFVRLTPKASCNAIDGVGETSDGYAKILSGPGSSLKTLRLAGDASSLAAAVRVGAAAGRSRKTALVSYIPSPGGVR